jgi:hypothetical protein
MIVIDDNTVTLMVLSRNRLDLPGLVATMPVSEAVGFVRDLSEIDELMIKIRPADGRSLTPATEAAPLRKLKGGSLATSINGLKVVIVRHTPNRRDRRIFDLPRVIWEAQVDGELCGSLHATRREALANAREWAGAAA